jgi:hypothetical protein
VLRTREVETEEYGVRVRSLVLQVKRGTFTAPARDGTVTIAGTAHKFRGEWSKSPDGGNSSGFDYWLVVPSA